MARFFGNSFYSKQQRKSASFDTDEECLISLFYGCSSSIWKRQRALSKSFQQKASHLVRRFLLFLTEWRSFESKAKLSERFG